MGDRAGDLGDDHVRNPLRCGGLHPQVDRVVDIIHDQELPVFRQGNFGGEQFEGAQLRHPLRDRI
jgi:hypothetical protein